MGNKIRPKMPVVQRAKQFMPFQAVTGLSAALARVESEHSKVAKREVAEDAAEAINNTISSLSAGEGVEITYFEDGSYYEVRGLFEKLDPLDRTITVGGSAILLDQIKTIKKVGL